MTNTTVYGLVKLLRICGVHFWLMLSTPNASEKDKARVQIFYSRGDHELSQILLL